MDLTAATVVLTASHASEVPTVAHLATRVSIFRPLIRVCHALKPDTITTAPTAYSVIVPVSRAAGQAKLIV